MLLNFKKDGNGRRRAMTVEEIAEIVKQGKYADADVGALLEIDEALMEDNKEEFLRWVKSPRLENEKRYIAHSIVSEAATKCAAAVFDGETNGILSPDDFNFDDTTPMHLIAARASKPMFDLFLQKGFGFSTDVRCDWKFLNYKNMLPLNVTLRQFRHLFLSQFWGSSSSGKVAARLILEIHTQRASELEFVRSLALNTKELKDEFFNYANQGKMVEVGVLLLAAGDKLMPLCGHAHGQQGIAFNSFKEMRHFLNAKYPWSATNLDDSTEMRETLMLLDIYDEIGNQLTPYALSKHENGLAIVRLFKNIGLELNFDYKPYVYRSTSPTFVPPVSKICAPPQHDKLFYNQSQQPSIPTGQLIHTSSFRKIDSKYASSTPAKKLVNVNESLNSCKKLVSFMKLFRRGGRLV